MSNENQEDKPRRSLGDYVKVGLAYGGFIAIAMAGFTLATLYWSSVVNSLQLDLRRSHEELDRAKAELAQVKSEYDVYRQRFTITGKGSGSDLATVQEAVKKPLAGEPISRRGGIGSQPTRQDEIVDVSEYKKTASAFAGEIVVSLIGTSFEGSPPRYKVSAVVGAPGYSNIKIEK